ncbi:MAG TPA: hypothetical protein VK812_18440 [Candidatus Binatus sp.]|jgi:hypothetical protein|nr:hypothetical protein [Candidatus Binatus sp.]
MVSTAKSTGILLAEDKFPVRYGDRTVDCLCRVTFDLTRERSVLIDCAAPVPDLQFGFLHHGPFFLELSPGSKPAECLRLAIGEQVVTLLPRSGAIVDRGLPIVRVTAGIVNFNQYWFGGPDKLSFSLQDGTWIFEFTPVGDKTFLYPPEIQNESYALSHHLLLRKASGAAFSCFEAQQVLETLSTFLRFCAEHWVAPAMVVGSDSAGLAAMEDWGSPKVDALDTPGNWLDRDHGGAMLEIFPEFSRLMGDSQWRERIRTAVYWYLRADTNHVGPDGAIILLQAALETLAWHILVRHRRAISEEGFLKLPAADQLRLLLNSCSIPLQSPALLARLSAAARGKKGQQDWVDGPQAFVAVRNQLVHPRRKPRRLEGGPSYYEVLQLGKWYLELVLLRTFGFNGLYANRLKIPRYAGDVELVPWVETKKIQPESSVAKQRPGN